MSAVGAVYQRVHPLAAVQRERDIARAELENIRQAIGMVSTVATNACSGQRYKARLLRPHVHVSAGGPSLFKFPVSDVIRKGPDLTEEYGNYGSREEALIGRAYDYIESFTKNRYDLVPFDVQAQQ